MHKDFTVAFFEDEMKKSYIDYAMSVIVSRALPDIRDGLKPVHRRILFAMHKAGYHFNKPYKKCARIVGDVMGRYHPHGDAAIYDALVRMAQDFSLYCPLIDGQGNFGSIDGDGAASMRYTESRLAHISQFLLNDINLSTVDFRPNYDASETEPIVLPSVFPNLLVNGSGGIAVGMATNIPSHNMSEVIDACCKYVDNPDMSLDEMLDIIPGPDFPTGGAILGKSQIIKAYKTGKGIIIIKGKSHIEEIDGRQAIIITEIPYQLNKSKLLERIAEVVKDGKISGIHDVRDESDRSGIRVVVELKKGNLPDLILNQLYSYTQLQSSFGINMVVLDKGMPKIVNLLEIISAFVDFRREVITRRTTHLLSQARNKAHLLLGLKVAVENIDEVVKIIRGSQSVEEARKSLMSKLWELHDISHWLKLIDDDQEHYTSSYKLTMEQTKAILDMRLHRLTALEGKKIEEDLQALSDEIKNFLHILESDLRLKELVKEELLNVKNRFGSPRKTSIEEGDGSYDLEDLIPEEDAVVTLTLDGYIKRVALDSYRTQRRGGKGKTGMTMSKEDIITQVFICNTHTKLLFFSNLGQVYSLKLYQLPEGSAQSKGRSIVNLLPNLSENEKIDNIVPIVDDDDETNIIFVTLKGLIKKHKLDVFRNIPSNGKIAFLLDEGDKLVSVKLCRNNEHILISTRKGQSIRFAESVLRTTKTRGTSGVKAITLKKDDEVISMAILNAGDYLSQEKEAFLSIPYVDRLQVAKEGSVSTLIDCQELGLSPEKVVKMAQNEELLLSITNNGFGKCSSSYMYRTTNRGGVGIINMNLSKRTGGILVAVMPVRSQDDIILFTDQGRTIRVSASSIRASGRCTSGVILFKMQDDEHVVSAAIAIEED